MLSLRSIIYINNNGLLLASIFHLVYSFVTWCTAKRVILRLLSVFYWERRKIMNFIYLNINAFKVLLIISIHYPSVISVLSWRRVTSRVVKIFYLNNPFEHNGTCKSRWIEHRHSRVWRLFMQRERTITAYFAKQVYCIVLKLERIWKQSVLLPVYW